MVDNSFYLRISALFKIFLFYFGHQRVENTKLTGRI